MIMKVNLQIIKFTILCVISSVTVPKIVSSTGLFSSASATSLTPNGGSNTLIARKVNSQDSKDTYIPPNNGGPDSQHGSGTR
jgi:hypothetical protein